VSKAFENNLECDEFTISEGRDTEKKSVLQCGVCMSHSRDDED
jgi:hypothetical protein